VLAAARAKDCIVQVGHIEHFNPVMSFLEKEIDEPRYITAERLAPYQPRGTEVGVVLDLMIHDIGIVLALVKSPIAKIDSVGVTVLSKSEDIANARIQFQNGCVANLSASRMSTKKAREIRIFQGDAYLSLDFMNQKGHLVKKSDIIAYGLKMKIGLVKAGDLSAIPVKEIPSRRASRWRWSWRILWRAWRRPGSRRSARRWARVRWRWRSPSRSKSGPDRSEGPTEHTEFPEITKRPEMICGGKL
jgi:predicted dehydrogenase